MSGTFTVFLPSVRVPVSSCLTWRIPVSTSLWWSASCWCFFSRWRESTPSCFTPRTFLSRLILRWGIFKLPLFHKYEYVYLERIAANALSFIRKATWPQWLLARFRSSSQQWQLWSWTKLEGKSFSSSQVLSVKHMQVLYIFKSSKCNNDLLRGSLSVVDT